ncbi:MAG: hypothetical protein ACREQY_11925, partial [Candidatus Binatia bacterium]
MTDGRYRMSALDTASGARIGWVDAVVDNDQSPLLDAVGTPYELLTNATCALPGIEDSRITADGKTAFALVLRATTTYPQGIYRVSTESGSVRQIVSLAQLHQAAPGCTSANSREIEMLSLRAATDGSRIAFRTNGCGVDNELWLVDGFGTTFNRLATNTSYYGGFPIGFFDQDRRLLIWGLNGDIVSIPLATPSVRDAIFPDADSFDDFSAWDSEPFAFSPDRSRLVALTNDAPNLTSVWLIDLMMPSHRKLVDLVRPFTQEAFYDIAWSYDGARLVVNDGKAGRLHLFDAQGDPQGAIDVRPSPPVGGALLAHTTMSRTRVSPREVALMLDWSTGDVEYVVVELASQGVRHVAWAGDGPAMLLTAEASLDGGESWRPIGRVRAWEGRAVEVGLPRGTRS